MENTPGRPDLAVVTNEEGRAAQMKRRAERLGIGPVELAEELHRRGKKLTREQVGKILNGQVPTSRSFGLIEKVLGDLEDEVGRGPASPPVYTTGEGQVTIVAEGVFGVARLTVSGSPEDAEATIARLIADIRNGATAPTQDD